MFNKLGNDRPEFNDIHNLVKNMFIAEFGSSIDLDNPTVASQLAGIYSGICDKLAKLFEGGVNSLFITSATGSQLDDLGTEWSVYRNPATQSFTNETVTGYIDKGNPTVIPEYSDFSTADGKVFHSLNRLKFTKQTNNENGNPLTDDDGNPLGQLTVQLVSDGTGENQNVQPNSIINADEVDGLYSCYNPAPAISGSDEENDKHLRDRIKEARSSSPIFSDNGIINAIKKLPNVTDVKLIDNREMKTDKYGNPAKSIHLYTIGGDDQTIADALFNYLYPTTNTVGDITKMVKADDGTKYPIHLDHAKSIDVYIHFNLVVDGQKFNADQAPSQIRQSVIDYFSTLHMGNHALFSRLFQCGYLPNGVKRVGVAMGTDKNNLKMQDISVSDFQLAVTHNDNDFIGIDWSAN